MTITIPSRVQNYRISATSPTEELRTLALIYAEIGDYASTILDSEHSTLATIYASKHRDAVTELIDRGAIASEDDLFRIPMAPIDHDDLASLTIDELYQLYRQWPLRHESRVAEGREHCTFYFEGHIVKELTTRNAANISEQFKIDYCTLTYANECENLAFIFSKPFHAGIHKPTPGKDKKYTTAELLPLIRLHADYHDIAERELLVEYVDCALDILQHTEDKTTVLKLATEIANLAHNQIIKIPAWVTLYTVDHTTSTNLRQQHIHALRDN